MYDRTTVQGATFDMHGLVYFVRFVFSNMGLALAFHIY